MTSAGVRWKVIAVTCGPSAGCDALTRELKARQTNGLIAADTLVLVIDDPVQGIGSGGATLNALLVVAENLASQAGYTVVHGDVLDDAHILILHMGRHYMFNSTGRAFLNIPHCDDVTPSGGTGLMTTLDHLIDLMTRRVAAGGPSGVWVCSTDMVLSIPDDFKIDWTSNATNADVIALSVHGDVTEAQEHGVFVADEQGYVQDILYRSSSEVLQQHSHGDGTMNVVIGVVYFNQRATEKLLSFHTVSPLNSCTYVGIDSGAKPIQVSLFFDLLQAMCGKKALSSAATVQMPAERYQVKWRLLRNILSDLRVKTVTVENGQFHYLFNDKQSFHRALKSLTGNESTDSVVLVNSVLSGEVALPSTGYIVNCSLSPRISLSDSVLLSGVDCSLYQHGDVVELGENIVYQQLRVRLNEDQDPIIVPVIFGGDDSFKATGGDSTFCNDSWSSFLAKVDCCEGDIWPAQCKAEERTLGRARLYPVMTLGGSHRMDSLAWMQSGAAASPSVVDRWKSSWRLSLIDLLQHVDFSEEFAWRRQLFAELAQAKVKDTIENCREFSLISLYKSICTEQPEHCTSMLQVLDRVAMESSSAGIAARALANIADVLGCMAGSQGGLRSGPSANAAWRHAYELLECGEVKEGVSRLADTRTRWLSRGDHLIRAARHYEGAAQILIRRAVLSARQFISLSPSGHMPSVNKWVIGESPARADIAGGWSDTPPISYEHGGAVTNIAILVDDMKPIGSKVRRIEPPHLVLVMNSGTEATRIVITQLAELRDYYQPQSPGALLKAAFVCSHIVSLDSGLSLRQQLKTQYGGGFELHTWSKLPHGSGLGTSSILAGVVMAVLWRAAGQQYTMSSLIHSVLHIEQMMTTGGGWQDQVGGLVPGIKIGYSRAELPLSVDYRPISLSPQLLQAFNDRFLLVYTGKTRLARNLLQNVVRNWYARDPHIVQTEDDLVKLAYQCEQAFIDGDLSEVGRLWTQYWQLKKCMATGCEPASVSQMIKALAPHVLSSCMAGAGGGGFLYVLTKEPDQRLLVTDVLAKLELTELYTIHKASVCTEGLSVSVEDE